MKKAWQLVIGIVLIIGFILGDNIVTLALSEPENKPASARKTLPEITFKNLSPPYKDYVYFEAHTAYPFQYNSIQFNLINAWWLAEISTLVYAEENYVKLRFEKAGFDKVKFFDKKSTQCYVASNDKFAVVAFRGSEIWKREEEFDLGKMFADLGADVDIWLTDWRKGGKVHRGFKKALGEVWTDLYTYIQPLHQMGCRIWFTGHSLGAALATLAADRFPNAQGLYTYGSPRVGDEKFKENFSVNAYRIINNEDIVTRVPAPGFYTHVGEPRYIDAKGKIHTQLIKKESRSVQPRDERYGKDSIEGNKTSSSGLIPEAFKDHVPLLYAIHIWNNIVDNKAPQ